MESEDDQARTSGGRDGRAPRRHGRWPVLGGRPLQLIRSAGLTVEQAQAMSLDEIVAHKFSRESTDGDQPIQPGARLNPARTVIATSGAPATHMSTTATSR